MSYLEELLPTFRNGAKIRSSMWSKKAYIHLKDGKILDESGLPYTIPAIAFHINDWELYQEPIDWNHIIINKCLCWFWESEGSKTINELQYAGENEFYDDCGRTWRYCRPVRKDEVSFYEDVEK